MQSSIQEPSRSLPVRYEGYDVVIAGAGIAGISAALAAARAGKKVLLLERSFGAGGLATLGLITTYLPLCDGCGHQVCFGISEELLRLSIQYGHEPLYPDTWLDNHNPHDTQRFETRFNPQVFAILCEQLLLQHSVKLLYGTTICSVLRSERRITHLILENKDGRFAVPVRSAVDATGDADLFWLAKEPTALYGSGNIPAAWFYETKDGLTMRHMLGAADVLIADRDAAMPETLGGRRISGVDADEISQAVPACHKQSLDVFLKDGPVSEAHSLTTLPAIPQLRMTRRICGVFTEDESDDKRRFDDSIGMTGDWRKRGPVFEMPLRTLYTAGLDNCLAAGRCISVTDALWDVTRAIPACAVTGEAAGLAMAMTDDITALEPEALRQVLRENGVRPSLTDIGL